MLEVLGREIGLTAEQMGKLNAHRPAIREDRETLSRCHQLLRDAREHIHHHIHHSSLIMEHIRRILNPVQVAKFFVWVEKHQHSVRTLTTLWDGGEGGEEGEEGEEEGEGADEHAADGGAWQGRAWKHETDAPPPATGAAGAAAPAASGASTAAAASGALAAGAVGDVEAAADGACGSDSYSESHSLSAVTMGIAEDLAAAIACDLPLAAAASTAASERERGASSVVKSEVEPRLRSKKIRA